MRIYPFLLISLAILINSCSPVTQSKNASKPNVILILADDLGYGDLSLYDEENTLGEIMKQAGYFSGASGKWGVGSPPPTDDPGRNGFDFFYGYINPWHAHDFYPEYLYRNGVKEKLPGNRERSRLSGKEIGKGSA